MKHCASLPLTKVRSHAPDVSCVAQDLLRDTASAVQRFSTIDVDSLGTDEAADLACEEVLAISRTVFETPLELDDPFAEAGGTLIAIARLALRLQTARFSTDEFVIGLVISTQCERPLEQKGARIICAPGLYSVPPQVTHRPVKKMSSSLTPVAAVISSRRAQCHWQFS